MPPAGILQTEMDEETQLELEIQQDLERIDLDNDNFVDDGQDAEINIVDLNLDPADLEVGTDDLDGESVPAELQGYVNTIQKQRMKLEEELEECNTLLTLDATLASVRRESRAEDNPDGTVVHEEWQELQEAAAQEGMTVEEYKRKLLQDIEDEPFELEEMDFITDDSEFVLPQTNIEEVLQALDKESESNKTLMLAEHSWRDEFTSSEDQQMVEKALALAITLQHEDDRKSTRGGGMTAVQEEDEDGLQLVPMDPQTERSEGNETMLAIVNGEGEGIEDGGDNQLVPVGTAAGGSVTAEDDQQVSLTQEPCGSETNSDQQGTVALVRENPLLEFEQYLREQFQLAEEQFHQKEKQLQQEIEAQREVEEQLMLALEEQKLKTVQAFRQEEENLAHQKEESRKKLDLDIEQRQKTLEADLQNHEKTIATLTAQLEEDRYQLQKMEQAENERIAQKNGEAATLIQRCYRGYSVRKHHEAERKTLAEKREQRKEEKWQQRVEEVDREIQQRKEEEKKKEEEARLSKKEEERKAAEEKRQAEEEKQRKKEEEERKKREAQEKKRQEEEEKKRLKEEQKRLKEEEKRRKKEEEEERKRQEEEERKRKKEEEQRKKEEERRRKEEEEEQKRLEAERKRLEEEERKRKKEEEKKQKEEEEKHLAEEEERKKEEEKKRLEEEERKGREEEERKAKEEAEKRERKEKEKEDGPQVEENEQLHKNKSNSADNGNIILNNTAQHPQSSEEERHHSSVVIDLEPVNANNLTKDLEERRLAWMKSCLPWSKMSNESWKMKSGKERSHRRPASAKKLPSLPDNVILEAAHVSTMRQVTTVELQDLPGYALSPLGNCIGLKHLKMTHCELISLDNLSQCRHLQCIDVQDNLIEFVDLSELSSLYTLNLSHNKLSSVHGLTGCTNLRQLDVSHNRLTKLAGLTPLRRLHTLLASNNQIVTTSGLEQCPTIQQLDLSANYLAQVEGLNKLALLTSFNLASNNLSQIPSLENNVLLQELILRENSIGPDLDLNVAWLPLLSYLDLSQNVIEELKGLADGFFVLKRLDLAVNQITDVSTFLPALSGSPRLEDLSLLGNAVLDEDSFRDKVKSAMPCLVSLNGEALRSQAEALSAARPVKSFEMLCLTQVQLHKDIKLTFEKEHRSSVAHHYVPTTHVCDVYLKYYVKSFKMAVEHRYAHEYGELSSMPVPSAPQTPRSARPNSGRSPKVTADTKISAIGSSQVLMQDDIASHENLLQGSDALTESSRPSGSAEETKDPAMKLKKKKVLWDTAEEEKVSAGMQEKSVTKEEKPSAAPVLSEKEKFEMALRGETSQSNNSALLQDSCHDSQFSGARGRITTGATGMGLEEDSGKAMEASGATGPGRGAAARWQLSAEEPQVPQLSQKEKFERALAGLPPNPSPLPPVSSLHMANGESDVPEMRSDGMQMKQGQGLKGVTADVVGDLMREGNDPADEFDFDLDNLEELMEGMQFDLDGFLDLDQFDFDEDFLEKGWRPDDTPQMPQNYPVLGRISSSGSIAGNKPPLPPLPLGGSNRLPPGPAGHHQHHQHYPLDSPGLPPGRPAQAWNMGPESVCSDGPPRVPPLRPPSSVASGEDSQAITTGRSRREDKLAEEWGFKDKGTAEMMMQRAKKMKYNAERRKKLSKMDPKQRLQLFRKLEEVRGISTVRPPPPRVLPRKEYFQAREEEAHRKEVEKHMEYKARAGRTFEWLHTQVGDYNVSSSRINPGQGVGAHGGDGSLVKTTSDTQLSHYASPSPHGYSPNSLEMEYQGYTSSQRPPVAKRHSVPGEELALTGQAAMFPPIKTNSASSQQSRSREKMSWRTEEVDKSVGWGGGKKRSGRK